MTSRLVQAPRCTGTDLFCPAAPHQDPGTSVREIKLSSLLPEKVMEMLTSQACPLCPMRSRCCPADDHKPLQILPTSSQWTVWLSHWEQENSPPIPQTSSHVAQQLLPTCAGLSQDTFNSKQPFPKQVCSEEVGNKIWLLLRNPFHLLAVLSSPPKLCHGALEMV